MASSFFSRLISNTAESVDKSFGWARLPTPLALPVLIGLRDRLRAKNLYDTGRGPLDKPPFTDPNQADYRGARTLDGTYNDLRDPLMGAIGSRFGRNVPLESSWAEEPPELLEPNPRLISRKLLTRESFQPATTLNLLAGAWIQFEVHDWFSHGDNDPNNPWEIPLEDDDPWPANPMKIDRTLPDPSSEPGKPPTFVTADTHWWDGSQVYGSNPEFADALRTHERGKLKIDDQGLPPKELESHIDFKGVAGNFWIGLALLHSLFMREHNAVCDHLNSKYPELTDQQLYQKARLVVAALMAKIHTVDWTPAVIAHPTTVLALRTNWYGLLGEHFDKTFGRVTSNEVIRGIPGSPTNHHGVPYSLTEEFVAVYRMHPLIPDDYDFRSAANDHSIQRMAFRELTGAAALQVMAKLRQTDLLYSFGTMHPGLVTLHNYPRDLQHFERPDGKLMDLGAVDILRSRELGVPRYNAFRRLLHLNPAENFDDLTDNPVWAEEIRRVYHGDIEAVDLSVGMFAEPKPRGFAFSDTAFRIFVLMASRRLNSDRFLTRDYTPQVYTQAGMDWIDDNTMATVLRRHHPELGPAMRSTTNAFTPWEKVGRP
jgi:hypothetical protein